MHVKDVVGRSGVAREGGYYYRAKAVHFVDDQGVNTDATHYSDYILIE